MARENLLAYGLHKYSRNFLLVLAFQRSVVTDVEVRLSPTARLPGVSEGIGHA